MKFNLILVFALGFLMGCEKDKVDIPSSNCTVSTIELTRTDEAVKEASVIVVAVNPNDPKTTYHLIPANGVPWGSCNLPRQFAKDSLKVYVSGYFLTFPGLELMNLVPLPFEVTAVKLR